MDKEFMEHIELDLSGLINVNGKEFQVLLTHNPENAAGWELSIVDSDSHFYHASNSVQDCFDTTLVELIRTEGV